MNNNTPTISERVIQAFLCNKPDSEATRLADASPALLAALRMPLLLLHNSDEQGHCKCSQCAFVMAARTAIAEAEGRAG